MSAVNLCRFVRAVRCTPALSALTHNTTHIEHRRGVRYWYGEYMQNLQRRKDEEIFKGQRKTVRRKDMLEWNLDAELFALSARLGEKLEPSLLRTAVSSPSYVAEQQSKQEELGLEPAALTSHSHMAGQGAEFMQTYIHNYVRQSHPYLPLEGVRAVTSHLTSEQVLSTVAHGMGLQEIINTAEHPPSAETYSETVRAMVAAVCKSSGDAAAGEFVRDFIVVQLVGVDVCDVWDIVNPLGVLGRILATEGRGEPEPRLTRRAGDNTLEAVYSVAIYSDRQYLGEAPAETIEDAVEMAARDSLRRMFKLDKQMPPLNMKLAANTDVKPALSLDSWTSNIVQC